MKNIFTDTLTKWDLELIEFGRMPKADEFWDKDPGEKGTIDTPAKDVGAWLIGWWIPVILACAYAYWACGGNLMLLWTGYS